MAIEGDAGVPPDIALPSAPTQESATGSEPVAATAEKTDSRWPRRVAERLVAWFVFGVVFSLLPLIFVAIKGAMDPHGTSLVQVLGGGEMFIAGAVTAAGSVGELFSTLRTRATTFGESLAAGTCLLCSILNSVAYVEVQPDNPHTVVIASYISFAITYLASGCCVAMAASR
jgi:hypothetical protein